MGRGDILDGEKCTMSGACYIVSSRVQCDCDAIVQTIDDRGSGCPGNCRAIWVDWARGDISVLDPHRGIVGNRNNRGLAVQFPYIGWIIVMLM